MQGGIPTLLALPLLLAAACSTEHGAVQDPLSDFKIVDLTHAFDDRTVFWPTGQPFRHHRTAWGEQPGGFWYSAYDLAMSEHCGTHLNAPIHFAEGQSTVGNLTLDELAGPLAILDVRERCEANPDYAVTVADLEADEAAHGPIEAGTAVLVRTGWSRHWPDTLRYLGADTPGRADNLHFPGVAPETASMLVEREVSVVGIDTASMDPGTSTDFPAHRLLAGGGIPLLENVASLDGIPPRGAHLLAFPMKIGAGSGAPCRVAALVPFSQ